ncbi:oligoribonuclease [Aquisalimonas lutea]|uniref:oligoribonuclease n=1 Tax=Aquisalimonas lutea TaxID=1327750 RepID=UPI0025B5B288|nr:oligoribonuclease [Aquisalimonas lutea]MDN3518335.1 oligoribonuclease [Aquisalimonas lutea]
MPQSAENLIWIDLEMTGLDTDRDRIIEIATVVTDSQLTILAEGPMIAIHQPDQVLQGMDDWNTRQHGQSGLVDRVRRSDYDEAAAERETLAFLEQWVPAGRSPMCGNSICQDRRFLHRCMPELESYFHYRHVDVSTLKELAQRWNPDLVKEFRKSGAHLAMDDVKESIRELRFYRERLFNLPQAL